MLEDYVEKWPTPKIENFRYMLRSGMMGMLTIMQDTNTWTAGRTCGRKGGVRTLQAEAAAAYPRCAAIPCLRKARWHSLGRHGVL